MGAFSDSMSALAVKLLTKFGQTISFTNIVEGTFNPVTNTTSVDTLTPYTALAAPSDYTRFERDLESVRQDDVKLLIQSSTEPTIGDTFILDTVTYEVIAVDKVKAQGDTIVYTVQGRV